MELWTEVRRRVLTGEISRWPAQPVGRRIRQRDPTSAKEIKAADARGGELGLNNDEICFYDALAKNESAVEVMGIDELKVIATELVVTVRQKVSVDWTERESARARIRVIVRRILRKHGYPPDLQEEATKLVLEQAAALSAEWAG